MDKSSLVEKGVAAEPIETVTEMRQPGLRRQGQKIPTENVPLTIHSVLVSQ